MKINKSGPVVLSRINFRETDLVVLFQLWTEASEAEPEPEMGVQALDD